MLLHLTTLVVAQAEQLADPLQPLLQSDNPTIATVGAIVALLFGADKIAFWVNKFRPQRDGANGDELTKVVECLKLLVQSHEEGRRENRDLHQRTERVLEALREVRQ